MQVVCDTCGKSVAGKRRLQEHIQRKHNSIFSCKHCDQIFKSNEELKAHKLKSHKPAIKPQMCPHCGKIIKSYGMKRHILTHISDITCKICREKFLTQEELDAHTKRHEENPNYRILKKRNIQEWMNILIKYFRCRIIYVLVTIRINKLEGEGTRDKRTEEKLF